MNGVVTPLIVDMGALNRAITTLLNPEFIFFLVLGVLLGIIVGATPGIGASVGMALLIPLTFPMDGLTAFVLLIGIYSGSAYAGSVPAVLINTPGGGASAAAVFEGYPLAQKGKAKDAIAATAAASAIGGSFAILVLFPVLQQILPIIQMFGSPEYFLITLMGLSLITIISRGAIIKGIMAGMFGMMITTIGFSSGGGTRYTFGQLILSDGINFIAVLLGVFALSEMLKLAKEGGTISNTTGNVEGSALNGLKETIKRPIILMKSGLIGVFVGAVPGAGSTLATFLGYAEAIRSSDDPDSFGEGNMDGVVAVDSANNGTIAGALLPTLAFGIPGGAATAVLLGALLMHGLQPGPAMFGTEIHMTYTILLSLLIGNIVILVAGVFFINKTAVVTKIDVDILIPMVIVLAMAGGFLLRNNWVDPVTVFLMGLLGYFMKKYDYSVIALLLGVILGPLTEEYFLRSLQVSGFDFSIFYDSLLSKVLLVVMLAMVFGPMVKEIIESVRGGSA